MVDRCVRVLPLLLLWLTGAGAAEPERGVALSPVTVLARQVPLVAAVALTPGSSDSSVARGGGIFVIANRTDTAGDFSVTAATPALAGLNIWELGYEPVPDPRWLRLSAATVHVAARGEARISASVRLPDDPTLANRRFVIGVVVRPAAAVAHGTAVREAAPSSAGLALCARVLIETAGRYDSHADIHAPIAVLPMDPDLGLLAQPTERLLTLRNNTGKNRCFALLPLDALETEPTRLARLRSNTPAPVGWLTLGDPGLLAASATTTLSIRVTPPAQAAAGAYEAVLVLGDAAELSAWRAALAAGHAPTAQPTATLIRVRFQLGTVALGTGAITPPTGNDDTRR